MRLEVEELLRVDHSERFTSVQHTDQEVGRSRRRLAGISPALESDDRAGPPEIGLSEPVDGVHKVNLPGWLIFRGGRIIGRGALLFPEPAEVMWTGDQELHRVPAAQGDRDTPIAAELSCA